MTDIRVERELAHAVRHAFDAPPRELFAVARRHFVDCAGVALAGAPAPAVSALRAALTAPASGSAASVLGTAERLGPRDAAIANGMAAHFHDYDDDDPALSIGHPTAPVFAAICALAESVDASVDTALGAYVAGVETTLRVGRVVNPRHYDAGWHATATLGTFGATAAAALLLGLDEERVLHALGIAASMSAGIKCNFGSDVKPLQVGLAAGNGVLAAQLAHGGLRAADGALFGSTGYCAMHGGNADARAIIGDFGNPWGFEQPGLNVKIYPCCSSAHTALDGLLEILAERRVAAADIASIDVWIGPDVPAMLKYDLPRTPLEGKFSMRYCLAAAAFHGRLGLDAFTPEALADPAFVPLLDRVHVAIDATLPRIPTGVTHCSRVRVTLRDGQTSERQIADPLGSAARPIPRSVLRGKFIRCADALLDEGPAAQAFDAWERAAGSSPIATWLAMLCPAVAR